MSLCLIHDVINNAILPRALWSCWCFDMLNNPRYRTYLCRQTNGVIWPYKMKSRGLDLAYLLFYSAVDSSGSVKGLSLSLSNIWSQARLKGINRHQRPGIFSQMAIWFRQKEFVKFCLSYDSSIQNPHNAICDELTVSYVERKRDKRRNHNKSNWAEILLIFTRVALDLLRCSNVPMDVS